METNKEVVRRRCNALARLAYEQMTRPEGQNAKTRLQEQILKYNLTADDFLPDVVKLLPLLGIVVQSRMHERHTNWAPPPPPPPRPKYEVKRKFTGHGEYIHEGVCKECKVPFVRRSVKQGNPPLFCTDDCHTAWRREKARVRMAEKRRSGYAG